MSHSETPSRLSDAELAALLDEPMALEDRDDLAAVVQGLPAMAFVTMARRLREENRLDLLFAHALPEQFTALLDLDVWERDRIDVPKAREWFDLLVTQVQELDLPRGSLSELILAMDPEMWTFALAQFTAVATIDLENDASREEILDTMTALHTYETPDGFFVVGVPDNELGRQALRVIDAVYTDNLNEGRKLLLSIQVALPSTIEEELLRWRTGRLADLGFPTWEEAMQLLRPITVEELPRADNGNRFVPEDLDPMLLSHRSQDDVLARVMQRLDANEHGIRTREFLLLANELMVAQRFEPGDEMLQRRAVNQAQSTITLAFELIANQEKHPDPIGACADYVRRFGLRRLFRVGYGPLAKLRRAALALHKTGPISYRTVGSYLDRPWGPLIAALTSGLPELPVAIPQEPSKRAPKSLQLTHPMRSLAEVAQATKSLTQAHALVVLAHAPHALAIDPQWNTRMDEPANLRTGDLIRTALLLRHLRPQAEFGALDASDLTRAAQDLCPAGRLHDDVRRDFAAICQAADLGQHAQVLAENLLTRLEFELAGLEYDRNGEARLDRVTGLVTVRNASIWLNTGLSALEREEKRLDAEPIDDLPLH